MIFMVEYWVSQRSRCLVSYALGCWVLTLQGAGVLTPQGAGVLTPQGAGALTLKGAWMQLNLSGVRELPPSTPRRQRLAPSSADVSTMLRQTVSTLSVSG